MSQSINEILAERGGRYGVFMQHADIAQALQNCMRAQNGWSRLASDQKQSLTVIADKIARILNGDPNYDDSWQDIAGYSQLILDRLHGTGIYAPIISSGTLDDVQPGTYRRVENPGYSGRGSGW